MRRLSKAVAMLLFAVSVLFVAVAAAQADDVLRFRVTSNGGRMYEYWKFSNAARTLVAGDYIEYDVYIHDYAVGVGGIDIYFTDGSYMRDTAGWADQNGIGGHPSTDLRAYAYGKWYHRKLAVPASKVGKTISFWDMAVDGTYGGYEVPAAMYNNVCVSNGAGTVYVWAYYDGNPSQNALHFNTPATVQSAQMFPTSTRRGPVQVCSHLFYWYDAPTNNADAYQMIYDPYGLSTTGAWSGYGLGSGYSGYYSSQNVAWWEGVFGDMKRAGIDMADLICWGNHPGCPWFQIPDIQAYMVPALERSGVGIQIALFDDTTSEVSEWNLANGRGYVQSPAMPLSNSANWSYFYNNKILPFFQAIPQKFWATHNGLPVSAGGRPVIITYGTGSGWYTDVNTWGAAMWNTIKDSFQRDFGVRPWVIMERGWVDGGAGAAADGEYGWGSALNGPNVYAVNGYYTGTVGAGYDDRLIRSPGNTHARAAGTWMQSWYNNPYSGRYLWDCNLIVEETWNELWEGTGIERCTNYTDSDAYVPPPGQPRPGNPLGETFYMDVFGRKCVENSIGKRDYDATFLQTWRVPTTITRSVTSIPTYVRNDGFQPWDPNATYPVRIGFWLEDANGNQIANSGGRVTLPSTILVNGETTVNWVAPATWPAGTYYLRLDMVADGLTWFATQGDTPAKVQVTIL